MSDVFATNAPTVPGWLAAAEEAYKLQEQNAKGNQIIQARRHAEFINDSLEKLGIEPLQPARLDRAGRLEGAILVRADYDEETQEVRALWDAESNQVELHTADWQENGPKFGRVRLLNSLADVAAARRETPKLPAPQRNFRVEALRAIDGFNVDRLNNRQVEVIVTAINGLTAAVLHQSEVMARGNDRP
ncbi:hypothetical protein ACFUIW_33980 [Streptomyces sp. NPDC057245]|uniref:hypothetical protein n=1 Tax=Streptomyces sp. NPDC057245 TaxID=3346065 RepID=UPI00363A854A